MHLMKTEPCSSHMGIIGRGASQWVPLLSSWKIEWMLNWLLPNINDFLLLRSIEIGWWNPSFFIKIVRLNLFPTFFHETRLFWLKKREFQKFSWYLIEFVNSFTGMLLILFQLCFDFRFRFPCKWTGTPSARSLSSEGSGREAKKEQRVHLKKHRMLEKGLRMLEK